MAKRKRKKQRISPFRGGWLWQNQPTAKLETAFAQADTLINTGRAQEAIALLEPYLSSHSKVAELHYYIGYARVKAGDVWGGLDGYERAFDLSDDPGYWLPLSSLYLQVEMNAHALHAFRQVLKHQLDTPEKENLPHIIASLEQDIAAVARQLDISVEQVEQGLRYLEDGQQYLNSGDYQGCIAANQKSIKKLKNWPPPHNNLSLALFFDGQPQEALAVTQRVLASHPDNLQALSNVIRFLAWTGQEDETQDLWERLRLVEPQGDTEILKKAEAAAIMAQDETVYTLLKPLEKSGTRLGEMPETSERIQFFLAIAEANTQRDSSAKRRMKKLKKNSPWIKEMLSALQAGWPGPGFARRFPYFHSLEIMPKAGLEEFIALSQREEKMSPSKFRSQMDDFATRFPQIVLMAEKFIWEEDQPDGGISMLATIGTPAAYAALRRYGLSQAGDDDSRMRALFTLMEAGQVGTGETLRVWNKGEWQEVQLRQIEISDEPDKVYAPKVAELLNRALQLLQKNKETQAEKLFQQVLELEPRAKEAYNNLAVIYGRREEHERAKQMYRAAIDIDPTYVFPRVNLTLYLLDEDDVEGAEAMLAPLADATRFQPQEMAVYNYGQARISVQKEEYDLARTSLEMALETWPDYEAAQSLLEHVEWTSRLKVNFGSFLEQWHERERVQRKKIQGKLTTPDPTLAKALPLYSKDVLTGMGRVVIRGGGWSALRKAELVEQIIEELVNEDNLSRVVAGLTDDERKALRQVLESGSTMAWSQFDDQFGNDLEESPHWQYHEPETVMGRLRLRGLLVEATVENEVLIIVPLDLRPGLLKIL
ncbi:MAG: tetratricopeptide repeat protein [Anaerolineae bacterium]|nr:tetratricopeptide repeat protein [Anaerolineae bacterium]